MFRGFFRPSAVLTTMLPSFGITQIVVTCGDPSGLTVARCQNCGSSRALRIFSGSSAAIGPPLSSSGGTLSQPGLEVLPVALEPVRMAVGRAGRGRLQPEHRPALHLVERVDAPDAGPEHVAGAEGVALVVGDH